MGAFGADRCEHVTDQSEAKTGAVLRLGRAAAPLFFSRNFPKPKFGPQCSLRAGAVARATFPRAFRDERYAPSPTPDRGSARQCPHGRAPDASKRRGEPKVVEELAGCDIEGGPLGVQLLEGDRLEHQGGVARPVEGDHQGHRR